jgi:hypothetical protein
MCATSKVSTSVFPFNRGGRVRIALSRHSGYDLDRWLYAMRCSFPTFSYQILYSNFGVVPPLCAHLFSECGEVV